MISLLQLCIMILLSTGMMNHVLLIPVLLDVAGRDAWLSVMFSVAPALVWVAVVSFVLKRMGRQSLKCYLDRHGHVVLTWAVLLALGLYLVLMAAITMKDTMDWLQLAYLPFTPKWVISLTFAFMCTIAANQGIRVLAIIGGILLPFVILLGYFVMIANTPHKHYQMLLPILEQGLQPVYHGGLYSGVGFAELVVILLLTHRLRKPPSYKLLAVLIFILAGLTIGPLIGAITEFGPPEAAKQRYPAFEQWRLVEIGRYIEHVDFFSLYQWLSGSWVRITLALYLVSDLFRMKAHAARWTLLVLGALIFVAGVVPLSPVTFRGWMTQYYFPASILAASAVLLVTAGLGLKEFGKAKLNE